MPRVLVLLLAATGCSADPDPTGSPTWSDVAPIVGDRCGGCHLPGGIGPLPLATWREVEAARDVVRYQVEERLMPPWPAAPGDYTFDGDLSMSDEQIALLAEWVAADAPLGDADPDQPVQGPPDTALPQVDAVLWAPDEYQPSSALQDDYRCFVLEPDGPVEGYVRGYEFVIDNRSVIHHAKLVSVHPLDGGALLASEEALDPAPGFSCLDAVEPALGGPTSLIGTWVPGSEQTKVFPDGAGMPVDPDGVYVLVVHYHPPGSDGLPDRSSVALWLEPEAEREVGATFFTKARWRGLRGRDELVVPAGDPEVVHDWTTEVGELAARAFDRETGGADLLSGILHMHRLGVRGTVTLTVDGIEHTLLDIPRWDVDWQLDYWPTEPIHLDADDTVTVSCVHDNAVGAEDVTWGEGTDDEMCGVMLNLVEPASR